MTTTQAARQLAAGDQAGPFIHHPPHRKRTEGILLLFYNA